MFLETGDWVLQQSSVQIPSDPNPGAWWGFCASDVQAKDKSSFIMGVLGAPQSSLPHVLGARLSSRAQLVSGWSPCHSGTGSFPCWRPDLGTLGPESPFSLRSPHRP